ncbi:DNA polymerase III subunit delta [Liquorilactobacillus cacaonum]|uniref:DNA polymerase III subunit delta n=1 Tax=Liquorilactobacillus cacaonum DSM 21116 TaxID=1423729 RepID=A0A0R2CGE4_9LACO|nr:DNA polymerase III subunit delta [Liquorilactobacillus cacaonum]KRM90765.1 DNA polymerase III subunit delta [Liquorilactobacillus cacaonum DSM 21116]
MKMDELFANIKQNNFDNIYLVLGKEDYIQDKVVKAFVQCIPEEERAMNIGQYDMESNFISDALNDAVSAPFFGERKLIIIKHPVFLTTESKKSKLDQNIDDLINYVANPEPTTIFLVIAPYEKLDERKKISKQLLKSATLIESGYVSDEDTLKEVKRLIAEKGCTITKNAYELLKIRTEGKMSLLLNEISKLTLLANETKKITEEMVNRMVTQTLEQNIFDLGNLVLTDKITEAIEMYNDLILQHEEPLKINAILIGQIRLLLQVQILQSHGYVQGNIASVLKVHPYRVKLALQSCKKYRQDFLSLKYLGLVKLEEQMKSSQKDARKLFQLFMLGFFSRK